LGLDKQFILIDAITARKSLEGTWTFQKLYWVFLNPKQKSLNELIHHDFGMEHLDDRLCKNCNNSDTSDVTTSIHTHPGVLIIMPKHHEYINNKQGRVNIPVDFPINGFIPNQAFDNVDTIAEYDLFARGGIDCSGQFFFNIFNFLLLKSVDI
jgi:hypothetical protein